MNLRDKATQIYNGLNIKGAELGNASIRIIMRSIETIQEADKATDEMLCDCKDFSTVGKGFKCNECGKLYSSLDAEKFEAVKNIDAERIDKLDRLMTGHGKGWILRVSKNGRGVRLHESTREGAAPSVREAIDNFIEEIEPQEAK